MTDGAEPLVVEAEEVKGEEVLDQEQHEHEEGIESEHQEGQESEHQEGKESETQRSELGSKASQHQTGQEDSSPEDGLIPDHEEIGGEGYKEQPGEGAEPGAGEGTEQGEGEGQAAEEVVEEEEEFIIPEVDPAAPYDLTDEKEACRLPYNFRPELAQEIDELWELYQNHTPVYAELDGYITMKELTYMMEALLITTFTPEQTMELVHFCVRPLDEEDIKINYDQFIHICKIRFRDYPQEEMLRAALQVLDPKKTGNVDRAELVRIMNTYGHKLPPKMLASFLEEVDIRNDGTIGIEDICGTCGLDFNREEIDMMRQGLGIDPKPPEIPDAD